MKFIPTTMLALILAGASVAQAAPDAEKTTPSEQESLAMAALEGLISQPPERALPILKKVLAGNQTDAVKRRALFVLAQVGGPEAHDILLQAARSNGELRAEAIRNIGIGGDPKTIDALLDIYKTGDAQTKKHIMEAWLIAGRKETVFQVAVAAKSEDEAAEAIRLLGVMGATEELRKLADKPFGKGKLVEAYALSGDLDSLVKIIGSDADKSVRLDAVRKIGIIRGDGPHRALREIYTKTTDAEIKDAALQGMLISGDDQGVLELYRVAKTTDEKRALLRMLSMMDSDAALKAIDQTLENK